MKYDKLCEMDIGELMSSLMGQVDALKSDGGCTLNNPIQPTDNIGQFGNTNTIHIKETEEGGIEVDSKEMAIKLSADVFNAIKSYINKGE